MPTLASTLVASTYPDQPDRLAQVHNLLEEALIDVNAEALPDVGQTGVVGERFVQGVAEVPAMGEIEACGLDELPFRANPLEEHHQLQLEEDDPVDRGPAPFGIQLLRP